MRAREKWKWCPVNFSFLYFFFCLQIFHITKFQTGWRLNNNRKKDSVLTEIPLSPEKTGIPNKLSVSLFTGDINFKQKEQCERLLKNLDCGSLWRWKFSRQWKPCIIDAIASGYTRPSEMARYISEAPQRVIEMQLRELELHGIVQKIQLWRISSENRVCPYRRPVGQWCR